jgi:hypothetical protein
VSRANGGHHGQAAHGVQPGADHATVDAVVAVVPDQFGLHGNVRGHHALRRDGCNFQAQHRVENDGFLKDLFQALDKFGLKLDGITILALCSVFGIRQYLTDPADVQPTLS